MEAAMVHQDVNPVMKSLGTMPEDFRLKGKMAFASQPPAK
jgi:hypothetical protein